MWIRGSGFPAVGKKRGFDYNQDLAVFQPAPESVGKMGFSASSQRALRCGETFAQKQLTAETGRGSVSLKVSDKL